ncbi:hypothetical protein [Haloarcula sp. 1CSR25-25]|uniref:hypothetical protein n=1 Tax=Haloarcula sp. 1CSR25-25 TaxID=2862545 RepID=UPI002895ABFC|nr:hypothetical protein [Haloarcula sp. 1CSR25-25]MDT3434680.1 hypothetical protein [Haloarcula sp. 1CSR25-25]
MTGVRQTNDGVVKTSGGAAQTTAGTLLIDDWEDGDQTGWAGTDDTTVTTTAIQGDYSLEHSSTSFIKVTSGPGVTNPLPNYPAKGATVSWLVDTSSLSADCWLVAFGSGDGTGSGSYNIQARIKSGGDFVLREEVNGTESTISADTSGPLASDTIYEITLEWVDPNDATATAYEWDTTNQERGVKVAEESGAVDASHDTNNNGVVELWFSGDGTQVERVDRHVILEGPTI